MARSQGMELCDLFCISVILYATSWIPSGGRINGDHIIIENILPIIHGTSVLNFIFHWTREEKKDGIECISTLVEWNNEFKFSVILYIWGHCQGSCELYLKLYFASQIISVGCKMQT